MLQDPSWRLGVSHNVDSGREVYVRALGKGASSSAHDVPAGMSAWTITDETGHVQGVSAKKSTSASFCCFFFGAECQLTLSFKYLVQVACSVAMMEGRVKCGCGRGFGFEYGCTMAYPLLN